LIKNQADIYLHTSRIYKWDICAPNAILNNLGGRLTKLNGQNIDFSTRNKKEATKENEIDEDAVNGGLIAVLYNYDYFFNIFKDKN
jgi:Golgi-resident PAP phosphatase